MALDKYREEDARLGKAIASGTGTAFVPAVMLVDSTGAATPATGTTVGRLLSSAASDNATNVSAVAGTLKGLVCFSTRASGMWLKLYDKATAPASTDTPLLSFYLQPNAGFAFDRAVKLTAGLGYRITTGSADNDTGAIAAGDVLGLNIVVA